MKYSIFATDVKSTKEFCCNFGNKARNCNLSEQLVVTAVVLRPIHT
jgi:hypothetical protein